MDWIKRSLVEVVSFYLRGRCKACNKFSFCTVCIFACIILVKIVSMELIKVKEFVMFGSRWRVKAVNDCLANKFS